MSIYDILLDYDEKAFEVKKSYDYAGGNIVNSHNLLANKTFGGRKAKLFTVIDFCTLPFFPNLWNCAMNLLKHANFLSCFFCIKNDVSKKWGGKFSPRPDDNFSIVFRQKTTESNWIMVAIKVIHHCCLSKFLMIFCDTQCGINEYFV